MGPKPGHAKDTLSLVRSGQVYDIYLAGQALKAFGEVEKSRQRNRVKQMAQMKKRFEDLSELGAEQLPNTHFKHEGVFSCGSSDGRKAAVFAAKAWQFRIYGILSSQNGRRCFIGLRADLDKKQDKADKKLLEAAAKDAVNYI